tara:strand:- start:804 stop:1148 length:345 start_codon:yes stop_codon:yes gene_type:complete
MPKRTAMSSILVIGAGAVMLILEGCGNPSEEPERVYEIDFSDGFQQSDADAILHDCGATDITLEVRAGGEIFFEPQPTSDYEVAACVLEYIKESGTTKFGFVGNEKYVTPDESE